MIFLPTLYYLCFISCYFITSNIIDIKIYHNTKVLEYRPWPVGNVHYGLLRIHCTRLVLSWLSKRVLWTNPRTTLWTFGFSCLHLVWFSSPKWYFVSPNWVDPGQSWRLRKECGDVQACACFGITWLWQCEVVNVIYGCFEGCFRVAWQVLQPFQQWSDMKSILLITRQNFLKTLMNSFAL